MYKKSQFEKYGLFSDEIIFGTEDAYNDETGNPTMRLKIGEGAPSPSTDPAGSLYVDTTDGSGTLYIKSGDDLADPWNKISQPFSISDDGGLFVDTSTGSLQISGEEDFIQTQAVGSVLLLNNISAWRKPVEDKDLVTAPVPTIGNRYIVAGTGGDWSGGSVKDIAICVDDDGDPGDWEFNTPAEGWVLYVKDEDAVYQFDGSDWEGIISSLPADSVNDTHIDWGTGANQVSAVDVPATDSGGFYSTSTVEGQLQELGYAKTKSVCIVVHVSDEATAIANGVIGFCVPASMAAMDLVDCVASVYTTGTTNTLDIQIRRSRAGSDVDMLSTKLTVDSGEYSSTTAAASHVINASNDDVNEGDLIFIDVDAIHSTPAEGLSVTLEFRA